MCAPFDRMLYFEVRNEVVKLSSNTSIDYYARPLSNIFKIVIKKNPKKYSNTETKKYLVRNGYLVDMDKRKNHDYNWGNFVFATTEYSR